MRFYIIPIWSICSTDMNFVGGNIIYYSKLFENIVALKMFCILRKKNQFILRYGYNKYSHQFSYKNFAAIKSLWNALDTNFMHTLLMDQYNDLVSLFVQDLFEWKSFYSQLFAVITNIHKEKSVLKDAFCFAEDEKLSLIVFLSFLFIPFAKTKINLSLESVSDY